MKSKAAIAFLVVSVFFATVVCAHTQKPTQPDDRRHFTDEDRRSMRAWYNLHHDELPLGARKKDRLPHELETQLVVNEVLPEDLRARIHEVSSDFLGRVPPAADGCRYVFVGGHAIILERKTDYVYDIYNFKSKK